jgi:serine/threonine protein kinase
VTISLLKKIQTESISIESATQIILLIAQNISGLHEKGKIHGQIHASNVFISPNGSLSLAPPIKILPEVITKQISEVMSIEELCSIPPEVWNDRNWSIKSDIYALGALYYHLVVGTTIYSEDNKENFSRIITTTPPEAPISIDSTLPLWINSLINRCLMSKPDKRTISMYEIVQTIEQRNKFKDKESNLSVDTLRKKKFIPNRSRTRGYSGGVGVFGEQGGNIIILILNRVITSALILAITTLAFIYGVNILNSFDEFYSKLPSGIKYIWWMILFMLSAPILSIPGALLFNLFLTTKEFIINFLKLCSAITIFLTLKFASNIFLYSYFIASPKVVQQAKMMKEIAYSVVNSTIHLVLLTPIAPEFNLTQSTVGYILEPNVSTMIPIKSCYVLFFPLYLILISILAKHTYSINTLPTIKTVNLLLKIIAGIIFIEGIAGFIYPLFSPLPSGHLMMIPWGMNNVYISIYGVIAGILNSIMLVGMIYLLALFDRRN